MGWLLLLSGVVQAGEPPAEVLAVWEAGWAHRTAGAVYCGEPLKRARAKLAESKTMKLPKSQVKKRPAMVAEAAERVEQIEGEIRKLDAIPWRPQRLLVHKLEVGQIGVLDTTLTWVVSQVLGPEEMLVRAFFHRSYWTLAVRGVSTAGLVDDRVVDLRQIVKISGTKMYETVIGGSRTVFVVEPWDQTELDKWLPELEKRRKAAGGNDAAKKR